MLVNEINIIVEESIPYIVIIGGDVHAREICPKWNSNYGTLNYVILPLNLNGLNSKFFLDIEELILQ